MGSLQQSRVNRSSGVASQKIGGAKCLILGK